MWTNAIGIPTGIWALWTYFAHDSIVPQWTLWVAALNLTLFAVSLVPLYVNTWRRTGLVLARRRDRIAYMLRVNPLSVMLWWVLWLIPLAIGLRMYLRDDGLVWQRTEKTDANKELVREQLARVPSASLRSDAFTAESTQFIARTRESNLD